MKQTTKGGDKEWMINKHRNEGRHVETKEQKTAKKEHEMEKKKCTLKSK